MAARWWQHENEGLYGQHWGDGGSTAAVVVVSVLGGGSMAAQWWQLGITSLLFLEKGVKFG